MSEPRQVRGLDVFGLDLMIDGPIPVVKRGGSDKESATILVRGGPGSGKTILATWLASKFAEYLDGADVAYACLEVLPSELKAQHERLYDNESTRISDVRMPDAWSEAKSATRPQVFASVIELGNRLDVEQTRLLFQENLLRFMDAVDAVSSRGVRALVLDSVSDDYGLGGASVPRVLVDAVCKYAIERGLVLVVIEEAAEPKPCAWSFAVDFVIELFGVTSYGERELRVAKNRFGPSTTSAAEYGRPNALGPVIRAPIDTYYRSGRPTLTRGLPERLEWTSWGFPELDEIAAHLQLARRALKSLTVMLTGAWPRDFAASLGSGELTDDTVAVQAGSSLVPEAWNSGALRVVGFGAFARTEAATLHAVRAELVARTQPVRKLIVMQPSAWMTRTVVDALIRFSRRARLSLILAEKLDDMELREVCDLNLNVDKVAGGTINVTLLERDREPLRAKIPWPRRPLE